MNNNIKKLAIYGTIATLSLTTLSGCSSANNKDNGEVFETLTTEQQKKSKKAKEKEFLEYKHSIYKVVYLDNMDRIEIPDGYEIHSIKKLFSKSNSYKFGVFYINNAKVKVKGTYNKQKDIYEYNRFGTIVKEKETLDNKVIVEENKRLHLKK